MSKRKNKRREKTAKEVKEHNKKNKKNSYWKNVPKNKGWDTMSFEEREAERAKKKKERVYTKAFSTKQSFGPASEVRIIDLKDYESNGDV